MKFEILLREDVLEGEKAKLGTKSNKFYTTLKQKLQGRDDIGVDYIALQLLIFG